MYHKKNVRCLAVVCLICGFLYAGGFISRSGYGYTQGYSPRVGEVLTYKVVAKTLIYGADQTVKVKSKGVYAGHKVFNVQYSFNTIGLVWSLTKYSEQEELVLDEEEMCPLFTKREIHENGKLLIEETIFDYKSGYAVRNVDNNGKKESSKIKLPGFVQDNLSLQFFIRKIPLEEGGRKLYVYSSGTIEEVDCEVTKISEPLSLECGKFPQYYKITSDKAKITLLLANNVERFPLVIRKMADFGKVEARLSTIN